MNMQATEVKQEVEQKMPATAEENTRCAAPSKQTRSLRWWLIGGATLGIGLALYGGWDWLVAAGLSTFVIAMAPCLAMCALGLCMRGKSKDESSLAQIRKTYETQPGEPPSRG